MLDYAVMITQNVHQINQATIDRLRARGLSDEDILNTAEVTGLFHYYNRLVDALGIDLEDFMVRK
jgi:alkylhydroperoxidase family enzyme